MNLVKIGFLFSLMLVIGMGCATVPNPVHESFGTSFELAKRNQTLNPAASDNLKPVEGFNGSAAKFAMERYRRSFEEVPTRPTFTLQLDDISR
ncbi:hypothetical protein C2W62_02865 [Candidatus Entotheonella serta]|nr:hypothetical protein C2W62_02865 [Candidatus Entotheonella serta]